MEARSSVRVGVRGRHRQAAGVRGRAVGWLCEVSPASVESRRRASYAPAMSLTSTLYKLARLSATGRAVRKGYAGRRAKNILVGRALGRAGVWRSLWK